MEDGARKLVLQVVSAVLLLAAPVSAGAQADTASGRIRINGESFTIRHVYVSTQPGFFDRKTEDIRLLFTDLPLDPDDRHEFRPAQLARQRKLHAVEVIVDRKGQPLTGALFLDAFNGMASVSGMHRFEIAVLQPDRIGGRLFTEPGRTFAGITYDYDVTFTAAIPRPPTAQEVAAAITSPPGRAATAHLAALRAGPEAFIATLTSESVPAFRGAQGAAYMAEVLRETPADSRVVGLVQEDATRATATVQGHRGEIVVEFSLTLRVEEGVWKVERHVR